MFCRLACCADSNQLGMKHCNFGYAFGRARASTIQFYSGLGDFSAILYGLVRSIKPEVCVEIGSARGNSTCAIAVGLKENGHGKLHAIDPHMPTNWNDNFSVDTSRSYDEISRLWD